MKYILWTITLICSLCILSLNIYAQNGTSKLSGPVCVVIIAIILIPIILMLIRVLIDKILFIRKLKKLSDLTSVEAITELKEASRNNLIDKRNDSATIKRIALQGLNKIHHKLVEKGHEDLSYLSKILNRKELLYETGDVIIKALGEIKTEDSVNLLNSIEIGKFGLSKEVEAALKNIGEPAKTPLLQLRNEHKKTNLDCGKIVEILKCLGVSNSDPALVGPHCWGKKCVCEWCNAVRDEFHDWDYFSSQCYEVVVARTKNSNYHYCKNCSKSESHQWETVLYNHDLSSCKICGMTI